MEVVVYSTALIELSMLKKLNVKEMFITSTLNLKLEENISVASGVIYPCKRQEKRPFITLSFQ